MVSKPQISILHLITTLDIGGAETMLWKLLSRIDTDSFSNRVVSLTDVGPVGKRIQAWGIPVYAMNMENGQIAPAALLKLWRLLYSMRPRILQTWLYHSDLIGLLVGRLAGIRNICWNVRCSYLDISKYRRSTKWTLKLCSILSSFPEVVVSNSEEAQRFHTDLGFRAKKWKVIPNGFDLDRFKPDERAKGKLLAALNLNHNLETRSTTRKGIQAFSNGVFLIGFIARYDPMKDHRTFIRAACLLLQERKDVNFVLVGRDVAWENTLLVKQIPDMWKDHFHLLGEREDVADITAGLDIASSVSYGEGFPNVICEAMACGIPCVVTDVGDSARIVGNTGRVVPLRAPEALARAWKEFLDLGEAGRHTLGVAARKRVNDRFELSNIVKEYENLYTSLVKN